MAKSKDLFDETTMSFGEHLEILRVHLWKAIIGLAICIVFALFFGNHVVAVIREPIADALRQLGETDTDTGTLGDFDFLEYVKSLFWGKAATDKPAGITDDGLASLKVLTNLERLDARGTNVTAKGLRNFKKQSARLEVTVDPFELYDLAYLRSRGARCELDDRSEVTSLLLRNSELGDRGLKPLNRLSHLVSLDLTGTQVADEELKWLAGLSKLRHVTLRNTGITDDGLLHLKNLTSLQELDVSRTALSDDGLKVLQGFEGLKTLRLAGCRITDAGVASLAGLAKLEVLDLGRIELSDAGLKYIENLTKLKVLHVSGTKITDEGLVSLGKLVELERLTVANSSIGNAGLAHLAALTRLKELSFFDERDTRESSTNPSKIDVADEKTIAVKVQPAELAALLHRAAPDTYPEPPAGLDEKPMMLSIAAPEFREFRETAVNLKRPVTLNVQEAFMTYLKVALVTGFVIASPWVFYQLWLFVAAGLYPHERKYVHLYLPTSIGLFLGGVFFCFFIVFPFVLKFLLGFNQWLEITAQIRISEWISFAITLPVMFGLSFQLPLVMLFLERISIFEAKDYREKRRLAILTISIVAMLMTPADPISMIMMMLPLLALYELGIVMCGFRVGSTSPFEEEESD